MSEGESSNICIKLWPASYYFVDAKKWLYGNFQLNQHGIEFIQNENTCKSTMKQTQPSPFRLSISFGSLIDIKKSTSSFVFSTLTIHTKTGGHLFGSFSDRESVYQSVVHFWKSCLITPTDKNAKVFPAQGVRTKLAQDLLRLAADSESTMTQAAGTLKTQGEQIDFSMATMDDIHNDLDVADRVVTGLESWLGKWTSSTGVPIIDPVVVKRTDLPEISDFEILYSKAVGGSVSSFSPGSLWISRKDGVTILSDKQQIIQHFGSGQATLSRIRVVNPWEITLTSFRIGEPDLNYHILSTSAVQALQLLEKIGRAKIEYMQPLPKTAACSLTAPVSQGPFNSEDQELLPFKRNLEPVTSSRNTNSPTSCGTMLQKSKPVSDEDAQQLSSMLSNLKSMALSVQEEQNKQLENLDTLLTSVDRANVRVAETDKRVHKLLKK